MDVLQAQATSPLVGLLLEQVLGQLCLVLMPTLHRPFGANTGDRPLIVCIPSNQQAPHSLEQVQQCLQLIPGKWAFCRCGHREYPVQAEAQAHAALLIMLHTTMCIDKLNIPVLPIPEEPDWLVQLTQTANQEMW